MKLTGKLLVVTFVAIFFIACRKENISTVTTLPQTTELAGRNLSTGSAGTKSAIDAGRITVPNRVWKVVVVIPKGNSDLSRVTTSTRVIAVNTPNTNSISTDWKLYRTSVDAIESATGYNLLGNLSSTVQSAVESAIDNQ